MQIFDSTELDSLCVNVAGVDASIRAPRPVLSILSRTLTYACRPPASGAARVAITVENDEFVWRIKGSSQRSAKVLSATSALPQVGGAVVSSLIADIAESAGLAVFRAAVVERNGQAVAFVGDDWESGIVLTTHLLSRGWKLLAGDYALIDRNSLEVPALRKLLYVTLSFMDELPGKYRGAVEASPWYSTLHDIAFYAVDPTLPCTPSPWAESGKLRAVLRLDGQVSEFPLLERAAGFALGDGVESGDLERAGVAVADVNLGDYVATCDLLERWFSSLTAA